MDCLRTMGILLLGATAFLSVGSTAVAQPDLFFDQSTFEQATGAIAAPIPPAADFTAFPGFTGFSCTDAIATTTGYVNITISAPDAVPVPGFPHGICVIEADAFPYAGSFPHPQIARSSANQDKVVLESRKMCQEVLQAVYHCICSSNSVSAAWVRSSGSSFNDRYRDSRSTVWLSEDRRPGAYFHRSI